jgi:hypothetical protein
VVTALEMRGVSRPRAVRRGPVDLANARVCVAFVLLATGPFNQRADAASGPGGPASGLKTSCRGYLSASRPSSSFWRYVGNDVLLRTGCAPAGSNHACRLRAARMTESGSGMGSAEHQLRWRPVLLSLELTAPSKADLAGLTLGVAVSIARWSELRMKRSGWGCGLARSSRHPWARGGHVAGWLSRQCVRGGEPAAELVVKIGDCGDADTVGEQRVESGRGLQPAGRWRCRQD